MPSKLDELVFQVEAVLFASGKPLSVKEVTEALGLEDFRTTSYLRQKETSGLVSASPAERTATALPAAIGLRA